jgi:hypothetical protein
MKPVITFRGSVRSKASADAVYSVLADLSSHALWAGEQAPNPGFRLLTMDAPSEPASLGTRFSSSGAGNKKRTMTFRDSSVVVIAEPGKAFGFDTEARLERKRAQTWEVRFEHRYTIDRDGAGSLIGYTANVYPRNYVPYWLKPWMRPMTKIMVERMHGKHMENLARMAEGARV